MREELKSSEPTRVFRFTVSERAVHWLTALAFFSLLLSGGLLGHRGSFHNVMYVWHLTSAGILAAGFVLIVFRGNRRALRRTARELGRLEVEDHEWVEAIPSRLLRGAPEPAPTGKFNAGQKINFIFSVFLLVVLYVSGVDAIFFGRHHNFVFGFHGLAVFLLCFIVLGHLYMAIVNRSTRPALRGIITGEVDREWAHEHYPHWAPEPVDHQLTPSEEAPISPLLTGKEEKV